MVPTMPSDSYCEGKEDHGYCPCPRFRGEGHGSGGKDNLENIAKPLHFKKSP